MKRIFKVCKTVLVTVILVILFAELALSVARLVSPKTYPKLFGYSKSIVLSGSMEPEISKGDMLIYKTQDEYQVRDIVLFYDEKQDIFVTHRIVRIEDGKFITKGDANNTEDSEGVDIAHVHGKVVAVVPGVGDVINFIKTPVGIIATIMIILLIAVYRRILQAIKEGR